MHFLIFFPLEKILGPISKHHNEFIYTFALLTSVCLIYLLEQDKMPGKKKKQNRLSEPDGFLFKNLHSMQSEVHCLGLRID